jgi:hypothetical protein
VWGISIQVLVVASLGSGYSLQGFCALSLRVDRNLKRVLWFWLDSIAARTLEHLTMCLGDWIRAYFRRTLWEGGPGEFN